MPISNKLLKNLNQSKQRSQESCWNLEGTIFLGLLSYSVWFSFFQCDSCQSEIHSLPSACRTFPSKL